MDMNIMIAGDLGKKNPKQNPNNEEEIEFFLKNPI